MDEMAKAEAALKKADKNLAQFVWVVSRVEEVLGVTSFTGRNGLTAVVVVAFAVPPGPGAVPSGRAYDGVLYEPPMVIRMSTSMAKRFYNAAAAKLNGRKTPRGGGHGKGKA